MSYYPIRHGAEVKQYSTDLFASLILIALAVEWWKSAAKKPLAVGTRGGGPAGAGVVAPGSIRRRRHHPGAGSKGLGPAWQTEH